MNYRIEGMKELEAKLERMTKSLDAESVEPVLYRGAELITAQVQANVNRINKVTGNLSRSPTTKMLPSRYGNQPRPSIAAIDRKIAPHAHLVEEGARGGQMPAQPFFRPAVASTGPTVLEGALQALKMKIEGAMK
jgi:HK97 gp10 family phage protein